MKTNDDDQGTNQDADERKMEEITRKEKKVDQGVVKADVKGEDIVDINVDMFTDEISPPSRYEQGPIPLEKHYDVFKSTEEKIQRHLEGLDHEYHLTGFRVAYDLRDSSNEPGKYPHTLEFGHLELLDVVVKCVEVTAEEPTELRGNEPIPIEVLDALYNFADAALQVAAHEVNPPVEIRTGLFIVLAGSYSAYAVNCCPSPSSSKRLRTTVSWGRPTNTCSGNCRP